MKIEKKGDKLIIELDLLQEENNCYMDEEDLCMVDNLVGVVAGDEYSINQSNNMSYAGKPAQVGMPIIMFYDYEEFKEACKIGGLAIVTYPICDYCKKPIYGSFTFGDKGNMCYDCELKNRK